MQAYDAGRWLLLATLWSLQFILMRLAVPVFGTAPVAEGRALFASLFLVPWVVYVARQRIAPLEHWKDYLVVGLVNNVLPFICLNWAATALPAGYLAVINGLVPLWTALFATLILGEPLGWRRVAGFALGIGGIALIVNLGPVELSNRTLLGALAGIVGAALWGWAGIIIKQRTGRLPPMSVAAGSVAFAAVVMAPLLTLTPAPSAWTLESAAAMLALGLFCTGLAYLPFFTLVRDLGASRTLTVGLVVPALGVFWGWLLLDESVTLPMLAGIVLVVSALWLVLRR